MASILYIRVLQGTACWLQFHNGLNCWRAGRSVCKDGPYEGVRSPEWVGDALAASQIEDFKPKIAEAVISLKECGMRVGAVELEGDIQRNENSIVNACSMHVKEGKGAMSRPQRTKHPMKMCGCYCCKSALSVFHMVSLWPRNKVRSSVNIKEPCVIQSYTQHICMCTSNIVSAYLPCNLCYHPGRRHRTSLSPPQLVLPSREVTSYQLISPATCATILGGSTVLARDL